MKKHILKLLLLCCMAVLALSMFACVPSTERYKVNFVVDGQLYKSLTTSGNSRVDLPAEPTKDGYIFKGWYFDENKWNEEFYSYSFEKDPIKKDINIYGWLTFDYASHKCSKDTAKWTVDIQPNCSTEGKSVLRCPVAECRKVYAVESIPVSNVHTGLTRTEKVVNVEATCKVSGSYSEITYCQSCNAKIKETAGTTPPDLNAHKFETGNAKLERVGEGFNFDVKCSDCQYEIHLENVDAIEEVVKEVTCETDGLRYYRYSVFGNSFESEEEVVPATGHMLCGLVIEDKVYTEDKYSNLFSKIALIADADFNAKKCGETVKGMFECENCYGDVYINVSKPHTGDWVKTVEPLCYKTGEEILKTCVSCGEKNVKRTIPVTNQHEDGEVIMIKDNKMFHLAVACANKSKGCDHVEVMVEDVDVTETKNIFGNDCSTPDIIRYSHVTATKTYTYDEVVYSGHIFDGRREELTASADGWFDYSYVGNGVTLFDNIKLTCGNKTYGKYVCESCKEDVLITVYRPHSGSWTATVPATCTSTGIESFSCDYCNYGSDGSVTKVLDKLEHNHNLILSINKDNKFYLEGTCVCGDKKVINDVSVSVSVIENPTCKTSGKILYTCHYSGGVYEKADEIPATPHSLGKEYISEGTRLSYSKYVETGLVTLKYGTISCVGYSADTSKDAPAQYTCNECGDKVNVKVYRVHAGDWNITYNSSNYACIVTGTKQLVCDYCDYKSQPESFKEENHRYNATLTERSDGKFTVAAKCVVEGCGKQITYSGVTDVTVNVKVESTCSKTGHVEYTFDYAGQSYTLDAVIENGNHVLNGVDYETLCIGGKLPAGITDFRVVGDAYYFTCEECGHLVRVNVISSDEE